MYFLFSVFYPHTKLYQRKALCIYEKIQISTLCKYLFIFQKQLFLDGWKVNSAVKLVVYEKLKQLFTVKPYRCEESLRMKWIWETCRANLYTQRCPKEYCSDSGVNFLPTLIPSSTLYSSAGFLPMMICAPFPIHFNHWMLAYCSILLKTTTSILTELLWQSVTSCNTNVCLDILCQWCINWLWACQINIIMSWSIFLSCCIRALFPVYITKKQP